MNPLTNIRNIQNLNKRELELGVPFKTSWHQQYKDSAWLFIGGLDYDLTEGDVISVFSQYGEIVNVNMIRDKKTGKTKGFGFLCYENQLSTVLAVDNLNGMKLCHRTIRVDHVEEYKVPKMREDMAEEEVKMALEGCAPVPVFLEPKPPKPKTEIKKEVKNENVENNLAPLEAPQMVDGVLLPQRLFAVAPKVKKAEKVKKHKKEKKKKSKKSKTKRRDSTSSSDSSDEDELKQEKRRKSVHKDTDKRAGKEDKRAEKEDKRAEKEDKRTRIHEEAFDGRRIKRERSESVFDRSDEQMDRHKDYRPKDRHNEDRPTNRYSEDRPRDRHNEDRPTNRHNEDRPTNRHTEDRPTNRYSEDRPRDRHNDQYYNGTDNRPRLDDDHQNLTERHSRTGSNYRNDSSRQDDSRVGFSDKWSNGDRRRNDGRR